MAGVYQIYNKETNKRYIGSSINIERRLKEHKRNLKANRHPNQHLQNAWNKYQEYLIFEALEYCEPDQCLKLEQEYIDYYNSANREFGYNIDPQAASAGKHLSEETKQKISKAHTGKKIPPEIVEKVREANTGKPKPKQSEAMKRKYKNGYTIPRFTDVSADKQMIWKSHLSEGQIKRYSDYSNRPDRGKFNALKKRTGKSTEELTHSKNPLTRKRAIFAQNAKKWKHKGRKKK